MDQILATSAYRLSEGYALRVTGPHPTTRNLPVKFDIQKMLDVIAVVETPRD
jgi:hypothetical protein